MSIHDRDWYRDAIRKREAREESAQRYTPNRPAKPSAHWTLRLLWWIAILLLAYIIEKKLLWPIVERALTR